MTQRQNRFEGGDVLVQALKTLGVRGIFSVSGGPLNSIYRACAAHDLPLRHTRHEAAACFMADAMARTTGVPGVAAVTLGPGVTNAVTPALVAKMAGVPVLILGAQANTRSFDRGAGMSADHIPIMTPVTKWAARVLQTERISEYIDMAWRRMWAGRPGPVFLEIPVDVLSAPATPTMSPSFVRRLPGLESEGIAALRAAIAATRRPLLLLGDDVRWDPPANLRATVERLSWPFATMRLARGAIDEHHPLWIGPGYTPCNATLRRALGEADAVILLGHHFEFDLEFGAGVSPAVKVIQAVGDSELLGRNRAADLGFLAGPGAFVSALADIPTGPIEGGWIEKLTCGWNEERRAQLESVGAGEALHPVAAVDAIVAAMPADTIFISSHGNVDFWADARMRVRSPELYLRAGQSGSLGAEVPYGLGARFAFPRRPVVVFVGDGGIGYHVTEIETAARYDRPIIIAVLDDQKWGAIALPQRLAYGAEYEMSLPRRDWGKVAEGLGGIGAFARDSEEIGSALRSALASNKPAVIQIPVRSVISPYMAFISK
ncbi:MAG: thiamine pyrophosphate-binding protein [Rhodospirillales bacterium]|nr:thiamine pyrophosphate-binding protein [Rhodospirillales bacterium]